MKLIVACDPNGGIGYKNKLPWDRIQGDLPRFKELTSNKVIVMGRNTYESLPIRPLPNRVNVVVSSQHIEKVTVIPNLDNYENLELTDAFIIGGAMLIKSYWHLIDEIFLTKVFTEYTCDTFIDLVKLEKDFIRLSKQDYHDHSYEIYRRK